MSIVLVVDDDRDSLEAKSAALREAGYEVATADNGAAAFARVQVKPVDIVVSDVLAPDFGGIHLCFALRQNAETALLPVILITGPGGLPVDRDLASILGADHVLSKPVSADALVSAVARTLDVRRDGASVAAGGANEYQAIRQFSMALMARLQERNAALIRSNEELRASHERFRQVAESIREVFWLTDPVRGEFLYVSPAYEAVWGRPLAELFATPQRWKDSVHTDDRQRFWDCVLGGPVTEPIDEEFRILRPDGSMRWVRYRAFPVRDELARESRIAGVSEDITDRARLAEQFRQAQKMEAIGRLSGGVAHDFNNILTVILGRTSMLRLGGTLCANEVEAVGEIEHAARRGANLTRQLLLFSRREPVEMRTIDLNVVIRGVTQMLKRIVGEDFKVHLALSEGAVPVRADPGMIDQVLMNLAVNSRDAMPRGGVLTVATHIENTSSATVPAVAGAVQGTYACIIFSDTGVGIPAEVLPHIFEPFFSTKAVGTGTGLGLATAYGIVQQHGGWIEVESVVGAGTKFRIHLPLRPTEELEAVDSAITFANESGSETVLVVEDEPSVRKMIRDVLSNRGYRVIDVASGDDALGAWKLHEHDISLLITDLVMPGTLTGGALAARLQESRPALRVLFISGYRDQIVTDTPSLVEGRNFIAKPFELGHFVSTVRTILDREP